MLARTSGLLFCSVAVLALGLVACGGLKSVNPAEPARESTLVLGITVPNPEEDQDKLNEYRAYIDFMVGRLGAQGITRGKIVMARSPVEMAKLIRQGKVDITQDSLFPALVVNKLSGSEPLLNRWKKGWRSTTPRSSSIAATASSPWTT